ncbi:MAG TPA: TonB-dependent receptor [Vicinamibacterales bacterium]|nr:TonB-dependent receptor [Vicinamibacterales bacterium]
MTAAVPARIRATFPVTFFLLSFFLVCARADAQSLSGRAVDGQGRPVAGAAVVAIGVASAPIEVTADEAGRYSFPSLIDGRYDLTASAPGLLGEARGVSINATPAALDITMRVSAVSETLLVSAAQIDQPLSRTADSVTVITGQDLRARQITSLGAALTTVPGFTVARSGGPGTLTSLFPRGGESDYTLVLIDGVRANTFGGGLDLSQVPLSDVERIEVVRGPQSAVHGADAIGGVVQVITRHGGAPSAHAQVETGSRATRRALASTTGEQRAWRWQAGADYFADEGFTGTAANGEPVSNDDAQQRQTWGGGGWRAARGTDVQGTFRYVDTDRGAPGAYGSDPARRFFGVDAVSRGTTERKSFGARIVHPWTGPASRVRQRIDLDVADYDLSFLSSFGRSDSDTRRVHGRVQTDAALDAGLGISGGVDWLTERASFTASSFGAGPIDRRVIGAFGEARWNALERVSVQAGLRAEHITRDAYAANGFADDAVVSVNPKVSLSWLISPSLPNQGATAWTRLRISGGTGIRPPDLFEIAFTDNPGLKPERSRSGEAGVTQALAGGAVQLDATGFFNQYDDLIISVGSLRDVSRYRTDNVSNARARGLELGAAWRAARGVNLRASYTFLDTEIRAVDGLAQAPSPYRVGDALLRRPRHHGSAIIDWTSTRASLFAQLDHRGATLDAEPAFGPSGGLYANPGRTLVDFGGSLRVGGGVDAFARVLNLFDRGYEEVFGFPAPGRTVFAGVRLATRR